MRAILTKPLLGTGAGASLPLLVAITMTGTVAMHIFVPALPNAAADLHASPFAVQLTVTLFLCGLAGGQLVYGPISDRFGRRPVILASLALYLLGLLLAIPAPSIGFLIFARVLQSLGGCGSLVIGRAMVRDVSSGEDSTRQLAVLTMAMSMTPALAPAIGGFVNAWFGWRAIFGALALLVAGLLAVVVLTLPETNKAPIALPGLRALVGGYGRLLRSTKFRNYTVAASCGGTSLYAFLSVAPFLLIDVLHRTTEEVGLYCLLVSIGMAVGSALAQRGAGRLEIRHAARLGNLICFASALVLVIVDLSGQLSVPSLLLPLFCYAIGVGILGPNAVAGLMNITPEAAGTASSLYGFTAMAFGAVFTLPVALLHTGDALPVAVTLLCASLLGGVVLHRV